MIGAAGLAILILAAWTPIAEADFTQEVQRCESNTSHPDIRIVACTRNIQSGRFAGPNLARAYSNRGVAYKRKGQFELAIKDYDEAIRQQPELAAAIADRGLAFERNGDPTRALLDFKKAHALGFRHSLLLKKLRQSGELL